MWHIVNPRQYIKSLQSDNNNKNPKTFQFQSQLPPLPVPPLDQTLQKYLLTVQPTLTPEQFEETKKVVAEFGKAGGVGQRLQQQLEAFQKKLSEEKDESKKKSWLEDWWLLMAYHAWQDPIVITSNWYSIYRDHPVGAYDQVHQLTRAAGLVHSLATYRKMLHSGQIPVDMNRKQPLCMDQSTRIFSTVRVPGVQADRLVTYPFSESRHVVVMRKDQIYSFDIFTANFEIIPESAIQSQLKYIYEETECFSEQPPIGIFTSDRRDTWAKVRSELLKLEKNKAALDMIERAQFVVCLDETSPATRNEIAQYSFHNYNGRNRWFDKSFNLIVFKNGKAGLNAEHSPLDAPPLAHGCSMFAAYSETVENYIATHKTLEMKRPEKLPKPQKITWDIEQIPDIKSAIMTSAQNAINFISSYHTECLEFDGYGSDFLKEVNMSPDAFVQMAIQLSYYKIYSKCAATYETAQTRKFYHGRTETVRTLSNASKAFVADFHNKNLSNQEKLKSLQKAIESHVQYMSDASNGHGVDRHLLGLMMVSRENGESLPGIFTDIGFAASRNFRLSTSNLTPAPAFYGGFGPVVDDGYGVCYALRTNQMWFSVSSRTICHSTDTHQMMRALVASLNELRTLCLETTKSNI